METIQQELESFQRFVTQNLNDGGQNLTLEECLSMWRAEQRERAEANPAIRQALNEMQSGLGRPLDEFMDDFRKHNQIAPDA
jgi:hypothetical protein